MSASSNLVCGPAARDMIQNGERPVHQGESLRLELHPQIELRPHSSVEQTSFLNQ